MFTETVLFLFLLQTGQLSSLVVEAAAFIAHWIAMCSSSLPRVMWLVLANELWEVFDALWSQILSACDPSSSVKDNLEAPRKTMKSQQLVSMRHCMETNHKHTDIYVNQKSMESSVLVCYCNRAYTIMTSKKNLSRKKPYISLWSTNGPFIRIS